MTEPTPQKRIGRPVFAPTSEQRRMVQVLAAHGIGHRLLAKSVGVDAKTLRKAFRGELTDGIDSVKASMILVIIRAAVGGDWHAAKYWMSVHFPEWRDRREFETVNPNPLSHLSTEELEARLEELRAAGRKEQPMPPVDPTTSVH